MIGAILGSSLVGASSASKAASAQKGAAKNDIAFQTETRDLMREDVAPFLSAGRTAQDAYLFNLGLGNAPMVGGTVPGITEVPGAMQPGQTFGASNGGGTGDPYAGVTMPGRPGPSTFTVGGQSFASRDEAEAYANANRTGATQYGGFQASPGYGFAFDQGTSAVNALAGARGGLNSGRTMQDLTTFGQGIANQEFGNYLNRLAGLTDQGLSAATMQANAANATAGRVSNAYGAMGNASAAGAIGVGNAIQGGAQNYLRYQGYQAGLGNQWQPTTAAPTMRPQPNPFYGAP